MTVATVITLLRIAFVPLIIFFIKFYPGSWQPVALYVLVAFSDWLDGFVARKFNQVTTLGKFLDPLADKVLVCSLLVFFVAEGVIDPYSVALLLTREFMMSGLRLMAVEQGVVIAASPLAKWKTAVQMVALAMLLVPIQGIWFMVTLYVYYVSVVLAMVSWFDYFWRAKGIWRN